MATSGLSSQEVQEQFQKYVPNRLPENSLPSSLEIFLAQIKSPLVYILLVAGIATCFLKEYSDTVIILFAVVLNTILGYVQ